MFTFGQAYLTKKNNIWTVQKMQKLLPRNLQGCSQTKIFGTSTVPFVPFIPYPLACPTKTWSKIA